MAIKSLKMLSYVGAALKTILHFCYNQFNPSEIHVFQMTTFVKFCF